MLRARFNLLRQITLTPIVHHRAQTSSDQSIFSDETLNHLFSNQSSLVVGKVVRDHYEKLLREKSRTYEFAEELYRTVLDEKQQMKRELMYLRGILHDRGLLEEFRGYLRGILQPRTSTPMSTKKLYMKMLELGTDSTRNISIVTPLVKDLFLCFGNEMQNLSTNNREMVFNTIAHELDHLYSCLSDSVHAVKIGRHDRDFVICTDNLTAKQICFIQSIAKHFLLLEPHEIRMVQYQEAKNQMN